MKLEKYTYIHGKISMLQERYHKHQIFYSKEACPQSIDTAAIFMGMTMNKMPLNLTKCFARVMGRKWLWNHMVLLLIYGLLPVQMVLYLKVVVKVLRGKVSLFMHTKANFRSP